MTVKKGCRALLVSFGVLAIWAGCSSRTVTTSAEDQSLLQSQGTGTPATMVGPSPSSDATRMIKPEMASPLTPRAASETAAQPAPVISSQSNPSPMPTASLRPTEALGDVYFDYDRFTLRSDATTTLESNARVLKARNGTRVLLEGHCDERGTLAYNLVLGERRAQSVKRYLQELGVPASQIQITSYGKERPFCREHREACWQQNRRAHFVVQ
jgi:peptidoglycan-associated lipoprotein